MGCFLPSAISFLNNVVLLFPAFLALRRHSAKHVPGLAPQCVKKKIQKETIQFPLSQGSLACRSHSRPQLSSALHFHACMAGCKVHIPLHDASYSHHELPPAIFKVGSARESRDMEKNTASPCASLTRCFTAPKREENECEVLELFMPCGRQGEILCSSSTHIFQHLCLQGSCSLVQWKAQKFLIESLSIFCPCSSRDKISITREQSKYLKEQERRKNMQVKKNFSIRICFQMCLQHCHQLLKCSLRSTGKLPEITHCVSSCNFGDGQDEQDCPVKRVFLQIPIQRYSSRCHQQAPPKTQPQQPLCWPRRRQGWD